MFYIAQFDDRSVVITRIIDIYDEDYETGQLTDDVTAGVTSRTERISTFVNHL